MISSYFIIFIIFSFIGWVYECIYCAAKSGHWDNRGFLFGPVCPIYGVGITLGMFVFIDSGLFPGKNTPFWQIYIISALVSAILEYSVSYILEKLFNAMWWDYSSVPLNLNGRICLPATLGFGIAGVISVKLLIPFISIYTDYIRNYPYINEPLSLILAMLLGMDLALTVASISSLISVMNEMQERFDRRMESSVEKVADTKEFIMEKLEETPQLLKSRTSSLASHHVRQLKNIRKIRISKYIPVWEQLKKEISNGLK